MIKYLNIPFERLSIVTRRHPREIKPPLVVEAKNVYLSRSDLQPQVRPPLVDISDSIASIVGTNAQFSVGDDEADFVNAYYYSWGIGHGIYFTKFGPIIDTSAAVDPIYSTYSEGTMTSTSGSTSVSISGTGIDLLSNCWPGCLLKYGGLFYEIVSVVDSDTIIVNASPGDHTDVSYEILKVHDVMNVSYPFHIGQFGINVIYSMPTYMLPFESRRISGPFYMNLQDYETSSVWLPGGDPEQSSSTIEVKNFASPMYMNCVELYDRGLPRDVEVPLLFAGNDDLYLYGIGSSYLGSARGPSKYISATGSITSSPNSIARLDPLDGGVSTGVETVWDEDFSTDVSSNFSEIIAGGSGTTWDYFSGSSYGKSACFYYSTIPGTAWSVTQDSTSISSDNFEGTFQVFHKVGTSASTYGSSKAEVGIAFRTATGVNGYIISFLMESTHPAASQTGTLYLYKLSSSSKSTLASKSTTLSTDTVYYSTGAWTWYISDLFNLRVKVNGSNFKARVWKDGTTEPSSWDLDYTDSSYSAASKFSLYSMVDNGTNANVRAFIDTISINSLASFNDFSSSIVSCSAYGSLSGKDISLFVGYDNGNIVRCDATKSYGVGYSGSSPTEYQHAIHYDYAATSSNIGNRSRINRIRHIGYANPSDGDTTVWACCDNGILVYDCANGLEVDVGTSMSLNDIASSRRKNTASTIDGDICTVGAGGTIYVCDAQNDPTSATNWSSQTSGTAYDLNRVFWSEYNSKFVAFGNGGAVTLSDNAQGTAWTLKTAPNGTENIVDVATDFIGRTFVLVTADGKAYATDDFTNYTSITLDITPTGVYYSERLRLFFFGSTDGEIEVAYTNYVLTDTTVDKTIVVPEYPVGTYFNATFVYAGVDGIFTAATYGGALTQKVSPSTGEFFTWDAMFASSGSILLLGTYDSSGFRIHKTTDAITFTVTSISYDTPGTPIIVYDSSSSKFVFTAPNADWIKYSADGVTWTEVSLPSGYTAVRMCVVDNSEIRASISTVYDDIVIMGKTGSHYNLLIGRWDGSTYNFTTYSYLENMEHRYSIYHDIFDGLSFEANLYSRTPLIGYKNQEVGSYQARVSYNASAITSSTYFSKSQLRVYEEDDIFYLAELASPRQASLDLKWISDDVTNIGVDNYPASIFTDGTNIIACGMMRPTGGSYQSMCKSFGKAVELSVKVL